MQDENVKAFKYELRTYRFKQRQIKIIEETIDNLYDALGGVRGIDPSKMPMHSPKNIDREYALRDHIAMLDSKLRQLRSHTDEIEQILERMDTSVREAVISVYADGNTIDKVSRSMYISGNALMHRMNREIKKALLV